MAADRLGWGSGRRWLGAAAGAEADLALDVSALSTLYLGAFTFAELARAGRITELRDGGIERADALFATSRQALELDPVLRH